MNMKLQISVVIPVYNRIAALIQTLEELEKQSLPADNFEVIIIDDGSSDPLIDTVESIPLTYPIKFLRQNKQGAAAARNLGAKQAHSEILLFLDSDMLSSPVLLDQHLQSHTSPSRIVIGPRNCYTKNDHLNPLDEFDYHPDGTDRRLDKLPLTYQEAFTCNLSIRKSDWQKLEGFDERFNSYEDVEFAYRAVKIGMVLYFNPLAIAYHNHPLDLQERKLKAIAYTRNAPLLFLKHPELRTKILHLRDKEPLDFTSDSFHLIIRKLLRRFLALKPILLLSEWIFQNITYPSRWKGLNRWLYWKIIGSYQYLGLREGIKHFEYYKV